jgi:hypothetical protein
MQLEPLILRSFAGPFLLCVLATLTFAAWLAPSRSTSTPRRRGSLKRHSVMTASISRNLRPLPGWEGRVLGLLLLMFIGLALAIEPAIEPPLPGSAAERLVTACSLRHPEPVCRCVAWRTPIDAREGELEGLAQDADDPEAPYAKLLAAFIACAPQAE